MSQSHPDPRRGVTPPNSRQFGYTPSMERQKAGSESLAVAFALVSIATGYSTTYEFGPEFLGPVGIWTWQIAVVGNLAVAVVRGSLASGFGDRYAISGCQRLVIPCGGSIGWIAFTFLAIVVRGCHYTSPDGC